MRIWHQSFTDLTKLPGYAAMLAEHARAVCDPGTTVDIHGLRPGTYPEGVAPVEAVGRPYASRLADLQVVEHIVEAERQGYDAVAVSCFLDPGLEEARSLVDIPVVSSCEAALLTAALVARSFGLLTLDAAMAVRLRELVRSYGFADRVAAIAPLDPPMDEHDLDRAFAGSQSFVAGIAAQAEALVRQNVDIVIPAEGVLNVALVRNGLRSVAGAPVLDSYGALLSMAEMAVRLRRRTGLGTSRAGVYARPAAPLLAGLRGVLADMLGGGR